MRVVVLRAGALGDIITTFPVLSALRGADGRASEILMVTAPRVGRLAVHLGLADGVQDLGGMDMLWLFGGGGRPDWSRFDLAVTFVGGEEELRQAGVARVLAGDAGGPLLPIHRQLLHALEPLGLADATMEGLHRGSLSSGPICLAPGTAGAGKHWPRERWMALDAALCALGHPPLWVAGPLEDGSVWPVPKERLRVETDLLRTAGLAGGARAWIGCDTGTSHLAAWMGAPTFVIFGPTDPVRWCPPGARAFGFDVGPGSLAELVVTVSA